VRPSGASGSLSSSAGSFGAHAPRASGEDRRDGAWKTAIDSHRGGNRGLSDAPEKKKVEQKPHIFLLGSPDPHDPPNTKCMHQERKEIYL